MDIVVANGFAMERCTFFSNEYNCCVLHNTRCKCEDYNPRNSKPMTNADRHRAMTDEELAETYAGGCPNGDRLNCGKYYLHGGRDCFNCWLDWLKNPVDKEGE